MSAMPRRLSLWVGTILIVLILAIFVFAALTLFRTAERCSKEISFANFLQDVDDGKVRDATVRGQNIQGTYDDGCRFSTFAPDDRALIDRMRDKGVVVRQQP